MRITDQAWNSPIIWLSLWSMAVLVYCWYPPRSVPVPELSIN
jgi:hypothetical protein